METEPHWRLGSQQAAHSKRDWVGERKKRERKRKRERKKGRKRDDEKKKKGKLYGRKREREKEGGESEMRKGRKE